MKKLIILLVIFSILGLLAACSGNAEQAAVTNGVDSAASPDNSVQPPLNEDGAAPQEFNFEVPLQTALIVGTFELEGTEYEVTSEQAAELLPLWMVLKNLLESDTAAVEEINALTNQIGDAMTDEQMAYINDLELEAQSMRTLMDELGLTEGFQRPEAADGEGGGGTGRPEGMPEGMGPGMGQGGGAGETGLTAEQMEAMQATREAGGTAGNRSGMMNNTALIDALIELLQSK